MNSPTKSCDIDPLPTWLLKLYINELLHIITAIVNASLSDGMPETLKTGYVIPLLKKPSLDQQTLKHYRPVTNLAFISKVIEKTVATRLKQHLHENGLYDPFQSAYRERHSTETALLKVQNDILTALDQGNAVVQVLLDLSAAFDTIDHQILLSRMEKRFRVTGTALDWLKSYLCGRRQVTVISRSKSDIKQLHYGVPQGSVLGPLLFVCYMTPLSDIIDQHGPSKHFYADDSELYLAFKPSPRQPQATVSTLELCVSDVVKTELLIHHNPRKSLEPCKMIVDGSQVVPSDAASNLGVRYDTALHFNQHISRVVQSTSHQLRNIGHIRQFLTTDAAKTLVQAMVTSRLDYGNSLLAGLPDR